MRVLDASAILHAWDNYPPLQFPGLWRWLADEMQTSALAIPAVGLEEVAHKAPECSKWLLDAGVLRIPMSQDILMAALKIKAAIGVINDQYHPKGVDENDLFIIAAAKVHGAELVTNEARQFGAQLDTRKQNPSRVRHASGRCFESEFSGVHPEVRTRVLMVHSQIAVRS